MERVGKVVRVAPVPTLRLGPRRRLAYPFFALASTVAEGGTISDLRAADFLFSCDASHPDTLRYPNATRHCLSGPEEPRVGGGHCSPFIKMDARKRLETSTFPALDVGIQT